jgi:fructokinase
MKNENTQNVVCFGEVLWDILPTGAVPGGAPMNVTYHLHKLNKIPALITSIGDDEKGKELTRIFEDFGVNTDFFQIDKEHETGKVYANPNENNEVVYDIVKPVAWDFISWNNALGDLVANSDYFIFGSLASRNEVSKNTLFQLLESSKYKVLDINLRAPHFNQKIVEELMSKADFLKINEAELELISNWSSNFTQLKDRSNAIMEKFHIPNMVVTLGAEGATLFRDGKDYHHNGYKVDVKDTVGSGDSFLAALISKWMDKAQPAEALRYASALGALIASKTGGCPVYDVSEIDDLIKKNE